MAGSLTDVWEKRVLDYLFEDVALGLHATNWYVALFTVAPTDSTTGTEVAGGSYARVAVARTGAGWNAPTGTLALVDNTGAITFPTASGSWGTVVAFGLCISLAGALSTDLVFWGDLAANKTIGSGDTASYAAGALDVTLD